MIPWLVGVMVAWGQVRPEEMTLAERDARARDIYDNGTALYQEGLYADAIAAFQESYRISGLHRMLLNVVNCHERLGRYEDAIAVLNRYRAFAEPAERERVQSRIEENRRRIETTPGYVRTGVTPLPIPALQGMIPRTAASETTPTSPATPPL